MGIVSIKRYLLSFVFIYCFTYAAAQPKLVRLEYPDYYSIAENDLLLLSDVINPLQHGSVRTLKSEIRDSQSLFYRFDDITNSPVSKDFVLFKVHEYVSRYSTPRFHLYDVRNHKCYNKFNGGNTYLFEVKDEYDIKHNYYTLNANTVAVRLLCHENSNNYYYLHVQPFKGYNYLYAKKYANGTVPPYIFKIMDTGFVSDQINDNYLDNKKKYDIIERSYKLGAKYNTVVFPYDVTLRDYNHKYNDGANTLTVYKLESIENNTLHFMIDHSGKFLANVPYCVKSQKNDGTTDAQTINEYYISEAKPKLAYKESVPVVESPNLNIMACYSYMHNAKEDLSPTYIIYDGKILPSSHTTGKVNIRRFRWYIKGVEDNKEPITMTFEGMTGIDVIEMDADNDNPDVYDLSGKKCGTLHDSDNLEKGYYVVDGKVMLLGD